MIKRCVVRVDQSPMNAQRWVLTLVCGHERWLTRKTKPKAQSVPCPSCNGIVREAL